MCVEYYDALRCGVHALTASDGANRFLRVGNDARVYMS